MIFLILLIILAWPVSTVHADPPDMYAQSQSIEISSNGLSIDWKIAPGPVIADAVWSAADLNHDGSISPQEAQAWTSPFLGGLSLSLDQQALGPLQARTIHWPESVEALRTGQDSIEVILKIDWQIPSNGIHLLEIHNSYLETNSLNWFSVSSSHPLSFNQPSQDNGRLSLKVIVSTTPGTEAALGQLSTWNSGIPNLPGFTNTVTNLADNLAGSTSSGAAPASPNPLRSALINLVETRQLSPLFLLGAFLLSLVLGSLHALTPGHGKTLVGAYLLGSRGRKRDAVFLGAIVTITHTGSVILLGLLTLLASHFILPSLITPWLEIISGLLVVGFGVSLFVKRKNDLNLWRRSKAANVVDAEFQDRMEGDSPAIGQSPHQKKTSPVRNASHVHNPADHEREAHHHHHQAGHSHPHGSPPEQVTWKSLLTLGVSGGLVPCPDAIAILLVAVAINRIPFGILLISAFSVGLALVLIGIGLAMVQGVRWITRSEFLSRISVITPLASAFVVTGLGIGLTVSAVHAFNFSTLVTLRPSPFSSPFPSTPPSVPGNNDGKTGTMKLLYIAPDQNNDDQLFIVPLTGGTTVALTHETGGISGYSIAPDHHTIVYSVYHPNGDSALWAINPDGSQRRLYLSCPQAECDTPEWYPDSRKFIYERTENAADVALARLSLWWLDVATKKTQPVFPDQGFPSSAARFSPDGSWLGYLTPIQQTLVLYQISTGKNIILQLGSQTGFPESWNPSGNSILFGDQVTTVRGAATHAKIYSLITGQTIDLGGGPGQSDFSAAWSPDGDWIAIDRDLATTDGNTSSNQVWLVHSDGSSAQALLAENNVSYSSLTWTPDSTSLIYSRYSSENPGKFDVYMVGIHGGLPRLLVTGGDLPELMP